MNDDTALETVRESLASARDSLTVVQMWTPLDSIVRNGRAARRRHRLLALASTGAAAVASLAVGLIGVTGSAHRAGTIRTAAFILVSHSHPSRSSQKTAELPTWARRLAQRLSPAGVGTSLQRRLDLAGNSGNWTPDRILAVKGIGLVVGAMIGVLVVLHRPTLVIVWAAALGACGFFLPDVLLYNSGAGFRQRYGTGRASELRNGRRRSQSRSCSRLCFACSQRYS